MLNKICQVGYCLQVCRLKLRLLLFLNSGDPAQPARVHDGHHGLLDGQEAGHGQGGGEDAQGTEGKVSQSVNCYLHCWCPGY